MKSVYLKILTSLSVVTILVLQGMWLYNLHSIDMQKIAKDVNYVFNIAYSNDILRRMQSVEADILKSWAPPREEGKPYPIDYFIDALVENGRDIDKVFIDSLFRVRLLEKGISYNGISYSIVKDEDLVYNAYDYWGINNVVTSPYYIRNDKSLYIQASVSISLSLLVESLGFPILLAIFTLVLVFACIIYQIAIIIKQKDLSKERENFTYHVISEMHNPISSISMAANGLESGALDGNPLRKNDYYEKLIAQSTRLLSLSNRVLISAKLDLKTVASAGEYISLSDEVMGTIKSFNEIHETDLPVRFAVGDCYDTLLLDRMYFKEAMLCVFDNISKNMAKDSIIEITSAEVKDAIVLKISSEIRMDVLTNRKNNIWGLGIDFSYKVFDYMGIRYSVTQSTDNKVDLTMCFNRNIC